MSDSTEARMARLRALAASNVTELHPEELFDKQDAGELSDSEAAELAQHLERCSACRGERAAREQFRMELSTDAGPLDVILGGALGALSGGMASADNASTADKAARSQPADLEQVGEPLCDQPASDQPASDQPLSGAALLQLSSGGSDSTLDGLSEDAAARSPSRRPRRRRRATPALIAGVLLFAGVAAAWQLTLVVNQPADSAAGRAVAAAPQLGVGSGQARTGGGPRSDDVQTSDDTPPGAAPTPRVLSAGLTAGPTPRSADTAGPSRALASRRRASSRPASPTRDKAAELFASANRERAAGNSKLAQQTYAELVRSYPKSAEARAARALSAQLSLDTGSPDQALAEYDRYLSAEQAAPLLTEEALVGRARALSRLRDAGAEQQAWRELLRRFPNTTARKEAERRLSTIVAPSK